jgi:hypothetical protein
MRPPEASTRGDPPPWRRGRCRRPCRPPRCRRRAPRSVRRSGGRPSCHRRATWRSVRGTQRPVCRPNRPCTRRPARLRHARLAQWSLPVLRRRRGGVFGRARLWSFPKATTVKIRCILIVERVRFRRHCEEQRDEAIHYFPAPLSGLLRGACRRAALCGDPLARNEGNCGELPSSRRRLGEVVSNLVEEAGSGQPALVGADE